MKPQVLTDQQLESETLRDSLPVAIEFWSLRCEACRKVAPVVSRIAEVFAGRLKVFKVNVDENPRLAAAFAVPFVPCLLLLEGGTVVASLAETWAVEDVENFLK
jgi:thioredoxin 1